MNGITLDTWVTIGHIIVEGAIGFLALNIRKEIAEVKVWILENFERRREGGK